jgi:hypothetical protein
MATVKVLLAGPCDGHLGALYKRIQTVNAKSGPFQVLFCVGRFFSEGELHDSHDNEAAVTSRVCNLQSGCLPQLTTNHCTCWQVAQMPSRMLKQWIM